MEQNDSNNKKWYSFNLNKSAKSDSCGSGSDSGSEDKSKDGYDQIMDVSMDRRTAFKKITAGFLISAIRA